MKTLINTFVLALALGTATFANPVEIKAPTRPTAPATYQVGMFSSVDGTRLNVIVDKASGGHVDIRLKEADGTVLYSQHVGKKEATLRVKLNVSELPDGDYLVEVTNGVETITKNITLSTKTPVEPVRTVSMN